MARRLTWVLLGLGFGRGRLGDDGLDDGSDDDGGRREDGSGDDWIFSVLGLPGTKQHGISAKTEDERRETTNSG